MLSSILAVPESNYSDHYDQARFTLSWRINFFLLITLFALSVILLLLDNQVFLPTLVGVFVSGLFLFILYRTRKFKVVAVTFSILGTIMSQVTLLFFPEEYHFVDNMWIMIITLFTYFNLGKIWGSIILLLNMIGIIIFLFFVLNKSIALVGQLNQEDTIALSFNFGICTIIIAYLISQYINTIRRAEKSFKTVNEELNKKNEEVEAQYGEKSILLKEIHHRVKNNLQVITSLLRLQSQEIKDPKVVSHFDEAIQRVMSMALIHEKMYQSKDISKINLKAYLKSLVSELVNSYRADKNIKLQIDCEIDYIQPKSLVSFGLLCNELISNSVKHAFKDVEVGEINISIQHTAKEQVEFTYQDNGSWKPPQREGSFGLQLISDLSEQLDGSFSLSKENGSTYLFKFKYENLT